MTKQPNKVLILGGYGNFGKRIAELLIADNISVIICGRNAAKANALKAKLNSSKIEIAIFDANINLDQKLQELKPKVLINTVGPFQGADYAVAKTCIKNNIHYIDLADGREFVTSIEKLHQQAKAAGVMVVSGASTVPALSSAVIENYKPKFASIKSIKYGISPGAKAQRGLATTQGILTYIGKKLQPVAGSKARYGWQDIYRQKYPELGNRWMANCDIPDLDILPKKYGIKEVQFSAGMESSALHLGIWILSWLVRVGLPIKLANYAKPLLKASRWFDFLGTSHGGMHVILKGKDNKNKPLIIKWFIVAKNGDGPYIPTIPAIVIAKKLVCDKLPNIGAMPCVGLVTLAEYLDELKEFNMQTFEETTAIKKEKMWFIYDGECPMCKVGASKYRPKPDEVELILVNKRDEVNHQVCKEINQAGLDLDKGMVIKFKDDFYQGKDALKVMAQMGTNKGFYNRFNNIFKSKVARVVLYPFLRATRNLLIKIKGVDKIKNLQE